MRVISIELLDNLSGQAGVAPRRRRNLNLHPGDGCRCHRLLNAIEPDSYIRPHRHLDDEKDETFVLLRGRLGIVMFAADGQVTETVLLAPDTGNLGVDIPHGVYHTAVSLASGTVFFEAKAGPYLPLDQAEQAPWAPADAAPQAVAWYLNQLRQLF
ncbi:MAG: WbuC family cupin fold metalloprotein [Desulfobacteraceae bacterium]|nr:WbuC family cupin fold metalloprotein [Desulfobacteraceae bacterium]